MCFPLSYSIYTEPWMNWVFLRIIELGLATLNAGRCGCRSSADETRHNVMQRDCKCDINFLNEIYLTLNKGLYEIVILPIHETTNCNHVKVWNILSIKHGAQWKHDVNRKHASYIDKQRAESAATRPHWERAATCFVCSVYNLRVPMPIDFVTLQCVLHSPLSCAVLRQVGA